MPYSEKASKMTLSGAHYITKMRKEHIMVQNLKVLALEDAYVTIGWDAVDGADAYKL